MHGIRTDFPIQFQRASAAKPSSYSCKMVVTVKSLTQERFRKMKIFMRPIGVLVILGCVGAQEKPKADGSAGHHADVNQKGDAVMGLSHEKTTHHFRILKDGGAIEVEAKAAQDVESRDQIRGHLGHIAQMFANGNFRAPMLVHGVEPAGVAELKRLGNRVSYRYEETGKGAAVRIRTEDPDGVKAVHEFLRFQIVEHKTGDALK